MEAIVRGAIFKGVNVRIPYIETLSPQIIITKCHKDKTPLLISRTLSPFSISKRIMVRLF